MLTENWKIPISLTIEPESAAHLFDVAPVPGDPSFEPWLDGETREEFACCYEDGDWYHIRLYGSGSFAFERHSTAVYGQPEPGVTADELQRDFSRKILPFVLQWHSWEVLHANGLVIASACVALCGGPRMGKSTLAHAWSCRGGMVFADDAVPFRVEGASITLSPIPFRIRARPPARDYFGALNRAADAGKNGRHPAAVADAPLQAIFLLDRRAEENGAIRIEPVAPPEALPAILKHSLCLHFRDRTRNAAMMAHYMALANGVPAFRLSYPTGLQHVGSILDRLTAHVAGVGAPCGP
jgi:hypothetical protein